MDDILGLVDPAWQAAFLRFVETGEADPAFMEFLGRDRPCQEAVEKVFLAQAEAFQRFARALKGGS